MSELIRIWFIGIYIALALLFASEIIRFKRRRPVIEKQFGLLPPPPAIINYIAPPTLLLLEIGMISRDWLPVRFLGVGSSLYAVVVGVWANRTLGRSFAPGTAILADQQLVRAGPFRFVRHPIYSAALALWLGAALGTLNWLLLLLWPGLIAVLVKVSGEEEKLLREKFGNDYDAFAMRKGRLVPRFW